MKRKNFSFVLVLSILLLCTSNAYSATILPKKTETNKIILNKVNVGIDEETDIIKKVGVKNKLKRNSETEILSFLKKFNKYSENNDFEKLKDLYTDDYINNDGFDKKTVNQVIKSAADTYKDVKFDTEIYSIEINGNYAKVTAKETAKGKTAEVLKSLNEYGDITSETEYTDYLRKENNKWKISSTYISKEEVTLKYGEAKYLTAEMTAPSAVPEGSEYEVGIKTILPGGSFVVGSIVNEEIVYPQQAKTDVFRTIKSDELRRMLKANKNGHNEYATASIGITRAKVEPPSVQIDMTGIAFVMKRINVFPYEKSKKGE